jgi:hypothetical protein
MNATPSALEHLNPASEWQATSLRLTAFLLTPPELAKVDWWERLVGSSSESRTVRPGAGQLVEQGTWEKHVLQLQIQLARVDWVLSPVDEPGSSAFSYLGGLKDSVGEFRDLMSKWLEFAPEMNRLALGAQLVIPTGNRVEAMQHIARMLPYVNISWDVIRDFIFRVNRPRPSAAWRGVGELNRLGTWQAVSRKKMVAALLPESQSLTPVVEDFAAFLELDVNTAPLEGNKEIPRDLSGKLLDEFISNAVEIAERGDFE